MRTQQVEQCFGDLDRWLGVQLWAIIDQKNLNFMHSLFVLNKVFQYIEIFVNLD